MKCLEYRCINCRDKISEAQYNSNTNGYCSICQEEFEYAEKQLLDYWRASGFLITNTEV